MTALTTTGWNRRYQAYEAQNIAKAKLCSVLTQKYLFPVAVNTFPSPIGFSLEQYQAAYKTLELAMALFSAEEDLSKDQVYISQREVAVSKISMKLMWEDLCIAAPMGDDQKKRYTTISRLADEKIDEIFGLRNRGVIRAIASQKPAEQDPT